MTVSEASLWIGIRRSHLGARFRRQVPIGPWIADYASLSPAIVIEVDDPPHAYRNEHARSSYIRAKGFKILRYDNEQIARHYDRVIDHIAYEIRRSRKGSH